MAIWSRSLGLFGRILRVLCFCPLFAVELWCERRWPEEEGAAISINKASFPYVLATGRVVGRYFIFFSAVLPWWEGKSKKMKAGFRNEPVV